MKSIKEHLSTTLQTTELLEMARIRQAKSGLSMIVLIYVEIDKKEKHHEPKIIFQDDVDTKLNPENLVPISIDASNPKILLERYNTKLSSKMISELKRWIVVNYTILMKYWNDEIYEDDLIDGLKSI